jgi:hypothetical protein
MAQIDLKQATLTIKLDRGILDEVREGDQIPVAVSFDFIWDYLIGPSSGSGSGGTPTIEDALKQRGAAAGWTSSDSDTCRPYAVDLVVLYTPDCSTGDQEEIVLADYRWEQLAHDLSAGTVASSGNCNVTQATPTRSAQ